MTKPYVRIVRWGTDYWGDFLEFGNGKDTWVKKLVELTSSICVRETDEEKIRYKKMFCENISECIGIPYTIDEFDKLVTKKYYQLGMYAFREYEHIVETNIEYIKQGKEPKYQATSIGGSEIMKALQGPIYDQT